MTEFAFAPTVPSVAIAGSAQRFPVHRIYCVGRNYAEHAREMGGDPRAEPPFFFMKPADAVLASGAELPYPSRTRELHHEIEMVVAIGRGGRDIAASAALGYIFGYAAGIDLTRRDLQALAKRNGRPWDTAKGFEHSAPLAAIRPVTQGHVQHGRIWLEVNGQLRQEADVSQMIWKVPEILAELSGYFALCPGDLVFTGTPAGVQALQPGDRLEGGIAGLETLRLQVGASQPVTAGAL
ncbi:MAG: fumarylacetoacetate hydrolase family protein [Sinobacteraceae bacterium]|nr:fumarylacetoacetate hydrolase family protein [Nevskiaceae bacterium]